MRVLFNPLARLYEEQKAEVDAAIARTVGRGQYILGAELEAFESELKESLVGPATGYAVGCNSGTDALTLSLLASGVGAGDEVLTVSHTAAPTLAAIGRLGARVVYLDVDDETWMMDPSRIGDAIGKRCKAILPVHLYGAMVSVDAIQAALRACGREDVAIVEDVAQAQGARLGLGPAGTLGKFGAFSFYPTKNLGAMGDGGAVFCRPEADRQSLLRLRNYGRLVGESSSSSLGINSRLDEVQAAILRARLGRLEAWKERKARAMCRYRETLGDLPLRFQKVSEDVSPAWHLCVIRVESLAVREALLQYLQERGIETLVHYRIPCHRQPAFPGHAAGPLAVTERLCEEILSLPMSASLRDEEQDYVIETVRGFFSGGSSV